MPQVPGSMLTVYVEVYIGVYLHGTKNLYSESIFRIHKLVICKNPPHIQNQVENPNMEKSLSPQKRKKLQRMVMEAFKTEIQTLPPEIQYIITDDLVTAFQNRITVFQKIQKTGP